MILSIRNSTYTKVLWGLMGLYILNISIDADTPIHMMEDLTVNTQESVVEFVVEKTFGYENAFAEYEDPDTENEDKKSNNTNLLVFYPVSHEKPSGNLPESNFQFFPCRMFPASGHCRIQTPPPKA